MHPAVTTRPADPAAAPASVAARRLPAAAASDLDTGALTRGGLALLVLALASAALLDRITRLRRGARGARERW
ncbi:MAG TPA: hypothetical protein VII98_00120 [Solirubrobacteraceae bacterium]